VSALNTAAKAAYEACPDAPHKRVPWDVLSAFWHDYWRAIAKAVLEMKEAQ
jgi:hypothetical protein